MSALHTEGPRVETALVFSVISQLGLNDQSITETFDPIWPEYPHLSWCTLCPVQWRTFLGFAVERVVVVAAPQLLTGILACVLVKKK